MQGTLTLLPGTKVSRERIMAHRFRDIRLSDYTPFASTPPLAGVPLEGVVGTGAEQDTVMATAANMFDDGEVSLPAVRTKKRKGQSDEDALAESLAAHDRLVAEMRRERGRLQVVLCTLAMCVLAHTVITLFALRSSAPLAMQQLASQQRLIIISQ